MSPYVIDMDPGIDDALALCYAAGLDRANLLAITCVAGNVPVDVSHRNAAGLAALLNLDVPVHRGCHSPLSRSLATATEVHGPDGLGGAKLPEATGPPNEEHGVDTLTRLASEKAGELKMIALGPLTNVARAIEKDPSFVNNVHHLVFMGGAAHVPGNVTTAAEFNAFCDPEAMEVVVRSGIDYTMVGLDVTNPTLLREEDLDAWDRSSPIQSMCLGVVGYYLDVYRKLVRVDGCALHDPLAVAVALDPGWVKTQEGRVYVEMTGELTRGFTAVYRPDDARTPDERVPGTVAVSVDSPAFVADFVRVIASL